MINPNFVLKEAEKVKKAAKKQKGFTAPDGTFYSWDKPTPPTQADIDAIVEYHESQGKYQSGVDRTLKTMGKVSKAISGEVKEKAKPVVKPKNTSLSFYASATKEEMDFAIQEAKRLGVELPRGGRKALQNKGVWNYLIAKIEEAVAPVADPVANFASGIAPFIAPGAPKNMDVRGITRSAMASPFTGWMSAAGDASVLTAPDATAEERLRAGGNLGRDLLLTALPGIGAGVKKAVSAKKAVKKITDVHPGGGTFMPSEQTGLSKPVGEVPEKAPVQKETPSKAERSEPVGSMPPSTSVGKRSVSVNGKEYELTPETILRTREYFADIHRRAIREAQSGEVRVNNLDRYIEWQNAEIDRVMSGNGDHTVSFLQRAHYLQTGESVPLLTKTTDPAVPKQQIVENPPVAAPKAKTKDDAWKYRPASKKSAAITHNDGFVISHRDGRYVLTSTSDGNKHVGTFKTLEEAKQASSNSSLSENTSTGASGTSGIRDRTPEEVDLMVKSVRVKKSTRGYEMPDVWPGKYFPTKADALTEYRRSASGVRIITDWRRYVDTLPDETGVEQASILEDVARHGSKGTSRDDLAREIFDRVDALPPNSESARVLWEIHRHPKYSEGIRLEAKKRYDDYWDRLDSELDDIDELDSIPTENVAAPKTAKTTPTPPKSTPPKDVPQIKAQPQETANVTGLANQVQDREALQGIINEVEKTKGKSPEEWQTIGKKAVEDGNDPVALAKRIGTGDEELTGEKVGILLEGKRRLQNNLNKAKPGDEYNEALTALDDFLENVQKGKGRWSDVGRSLQAGTELDTGNFAQVIERVQKTGGKLDPKFEAQMRDMTGKVADADKRISELEKQVKELQARKQVDRANRGPKMTKEELDKEFDDILSEFGKKAAKLSSGLDPELLPLLGRAAINRAKRLGLTLEEAVEQVVKAFGVGKDDVIEGINTVESPKVKKVEEGISKYKGKLDNRDFDPPTKQERIASKKLQDLRAERDLYSAKVQSAIRTRAIPASKKVLKGVAGTVRGTILGSDIGVLTRQGLFGLSRPVSFAKGVAKGVKSAFSEKALVQVEKHIRDHQIVDVNGATRHAGVEYRRAGLSLTDHLIHPEELVVGAIFKKIPVLKHLAGMGERFQAAFINTLRSDTFDRAIKLGYKENELKARANFINSATGRSNMKGEPAEWLQVVMTSPRYERSRWEMIGQVFRNPAVIVKDLATKKGLNRGAVANLQDMVVTGAEIYGLYKLAEMSGYEVDFDPTSADFLKMRKGEEVWDPSAGIAPRIRDAVRAVAWTLKPDQYHNWGKAVQGGIVRTISPAIKTPGEAVSQNVQRKLGTPEDKIVSVFTGFEVDDDEKGWQTFMPLVAQTVKKYLDQGDYQGAVSAGLREFVGQSVNRYPKPK